jgi:hypothetical protein
MNIEDYAKIKSAKVHFWVYSTWEGSVPDNLLHFSIKTTNSNYLGYTEPGFEHGGSGYINDLSTGWNTWEVHTDALNIGIRKRFNLFNTNNYIAVKFYTLHHLCAVHFHQNYRPYLTVEYENFTSTYRTLSCIPSTLNYNGTQIVKAPQNIRCKHGAGRNFTINSNLPVNYGSSNKLITENSYSYVGESTKNNCNWQSDYPDSIRKHCSVVRLNNINQNNNFNHNGHNILLNGTRAKIDIV